MTKECKLIIVFVLITILFFVANLYIGTVHIPFESVTKILLGHGDVRESWRFIVLESRLPTALAAVLCGSALAVSGLMLQTAFRNPLAGPSVLGINSGANLGVALVMLVSGGGFVGTFSFSSFVATTIAAFIGSILVMGLLLLFSSWLKSDTMLLIVGMMVGYAISSVISLLNFFATSEDVQGYMIWGMGSFSGVSMNEIPYFFILVSVGLLLSLFLIKPLNALLLGNHYAQNLGINVRAVRCRMLISTGLLTSVATAFCGPVSFLGLAVPHVARICLGRTDHRWLIPLCIWIGSSVALLCNMLCVLPAEKGLIPLGVITPMLGVPVIIYVLLFHRSY